MRLILDRSRCAGHAKCFGVAPDLFTLDEYGYSDIDERELLPENEAAARVGVDGCPENALSLEE